MKKQISITKIQELASNGALLLTEPQQVKVKGGTNGTAEGWAGAGALAG